MLFVLSSLFKKCKHRKQFLEEIFTTGGVLLYLFIQSMERKQ